MSRRRFFFGVLASLAVAIFAGYEVRTTIRQRSEAEALVQRAQQLDAEAAALRRERDAAAKELAQAKYQLAALPAPHTDDATLAPGQRAEIKAWLVKMKCLRGLFETRPGQTIPEMQFLTEENWLRLARTVHLETEDEIREALAQVRASATGRFMEKIQQAMQKYLNTAGTEKPASMQALAGYFDPAIDSTLLERYELIDRLPSNPGSSWGVQNRVAIDPDYDTRMQVSKSGSSSSPGLFAWDPDLSARYRQALRNYTKANQGDYPKSMADSLPFFDPPLDHDTAERLVKADRRW